MIYDIYVMEIEFYDTHTHLNDPKLYPNWKKYLEEFVKIWFF